MSITGKRFAKSIASSNPKFLNARESLEMQKRVDETIEKIVSQKFVPRMSASLFPSVRKQWENILDQGGSFYQMAKNAGMPKKYSMFMTLSRQKERDRISREKKRDAKRKEMND